MPRARHKGRGQHAPPCASPLTRPKDRSASSNGVKAYVAVALEKYEAEREFIFSPLSAGANVYEKVEKIFSYGFIWNKKRKFAQKHDKNFYHEKSAKKSNISM